MDIMDKVEEHDEIFPLRNRKSKLFNLSNSNHFSTINNLNYHSNQNLSESQHEYQSDPLEPKANLFVADEPSDPRPQSPADPIAPPLNNDDNHSFTPNSTLEENKNIKDKHSSTKTFYQDFFRSNLDHYYLKFIELVLWCEGKFLEKKKKILSEPLRAASLLLYSSIFSFSLFYFLLFSWQTHIILIFGFLSLLSLFACLIILLRHFMKENKNNVVNVFREILLSKIPPWALRILFDTSLVDIAQTRLPLSVYLDLASLFIFQLNQSEQERVLNRLPINIRNTLTTKGLIYLFPGFVQELFIYNHHNHHNPSSLSHTPSSHFLLSSHHNNCNNNLSTSATSLHSCHHHNNSNGYGAFGSTSPCMSPGPSSANLNGLESSKNFKIVRAASSFNTNMLINNHMSRSSSNKDNASHTMDSKWDDEKENIHINIIPADNKDSIKNSFNLNPSMMIRSVSAPSSPSPNLINNLNPNNTVSPLISQLSSYNQNDAHVSHNHTSNKMNNNMPVSVPVSGSSSASESDFSSFIKRSVNNVSFRNLMNNGLNMGWFLKNVAGMDYDLSMLFRNKFFLQVVLAWGSSTGLVLATSDKARKIASQSFEFILKIFFFSSASLAFYHLAKVLFNSIQYRYTHSSEEIERKKLFNSKVEFTTLDHSFTHRTQLLLQARWKDYLSVITIMLWVAYLKRSKT